MSGHPDDDVADRKPGPAALRWGKRLALLFVLLAIGVPLAAYVLLYLVLG